MNKFDSIRPYEDSEVEAVLSSLCSNVNVIRALIDSSDSSFISLLPFKEKIISLYLKHKTKNISSIIEYQNLFESIVSNVVNQSINSLSVSGLENLDKNLSLRQDNFEELSKFFHKYEQFFVLPKENDSCSTGWLAYPLIVKEVSAVILNFSL